jgi:hypothetical protein
VDTTLEPLSFSVARWVLGGWPAVERAGRMFNTTVVKDAFGRPVLLFRCACHTHDMHCLCVRLAVCLCVRMFNTPVVKDAFGRPVLLFRCACMHCSCVRLAVCFVKEWI